MDVFVAILAGIGIVTMAIVGGFVALIVLAIAFGEGEVTINGQKYVRKSGLGWWRRDE